MTLIELVKLIRKFANEHNKRMFTLNEITAVSGETAASVGMALIRARKKGLVERVSNIWFGTMDRPSLEDIALELKSPSYISFESALYRHGVLSQSPRGYLSVATTLKPSKVSTSLGEIRYIHLSKKLFFGFDEKRIALPEKALMDLIYIRMRKGIKEIPETIYTDALNKKRLMETARKFPACVARQFAKLYH